MTVMPPSPVPSPFGAARLGEPQVLLLLPRSWWSAFFLWCFLQFVVVPMVQLAGGGAGYGCSAGRSKGEPGQSQD